jgi:circadian clock protein KaiB
MQTKRNKKQLRNMAEDFEAAINKIEKASPRRGPRYVLKLYVAGATPRSARAIENIKKICDEHLAGRYDLDVIDIYQRPVLAKGEQIIAIPTLIKQLPSPLRKFIGDMSNKERILLGLDLRPKAKK